MNAARSARLSSCGESDRAILRSKRGGEIDVGRAKEASRPAGSGSPKSQEFIVAAEQWRAVSRKGRASHSERAVPVSALRPAGTALG